MRIRDIFATTIQERIEPVVKVIDRRPAVVYGELQNLVVTPQWERHLHTILDAYSHAADLDDEQGIGVWINGFFGSGKSLLMKTLGVLLENGEVQGQSVHELFLGRLPSNSVYRDDITRFLEVCQRKMDTTAVGGNLHAMLSARNDPLPLIAFKLFADRQGYTTNWPLAWTVEHQIAARGLTEGFRARACARCGGDWDDVRVDPEFHLESLYAAAADTLPDHFSGVAAIERATQAITQSGVTATLLVDRLQRWCAAQDQPGRRHKLLLQLDELGQWISAGNANQRTMEMQALAEEAAVTGKGRIWLAVTAHGDIQALRENVQQEYYAKIIQRFALPAKLSNEDINQVVEERLLRKNQPAREHLEGRFAERTGEITDLGSIAGSQRDYPPPDTHRFPLFYPFLPWTVGVIPDVVKGIAQAVRREEALTGSNRTMIGVVQGAIIETPGLLDSPIGKLIALADLYSQLASDIPIETKTDLNRIEGGSIVGSTSDTARVARALFLLGQVGHIPTTIPNVARALVDSLDAALAEQERKARVQLERLVAADYAKQVGEQYIFLTTQQRGFQEKVRARQTDLQSNAYALSQALKDYDSDDALRFERVAIATAAAGRGEREIALKLEIDGRTVRNPTAHVPLRVYSPFQRAIDPQVANDAALKQRSQAEPDAVFFRLAEAPGFHQALSLAVATDAIAGEVMQAARPDSPEREIAQQARIQDLPEYKGAVRTLLGQAVRGGTIFFRGSAYQLADGESASAAVRSTLAQIMPTIYTRFHETPYRLTNEVTAVKAALAGNSGNTDLQALGVFRADGTLNESHPLLTTLRGRLPLAEQDQQPIMAEGLRSDLERPPFGWDGNCAKVGLALLLRAAACRLIADGQVLTDPSDLQVADLLTRDQRFRTVRVQGVRSELGIPELMRIRGYMEVIFNASRLSLVAATLNNALGEALRGFAEQARQVTAWAVTAQCPLPLAFEAGAEVVNELLNTAAQNSRLSAFLEQAERLTPHADLLLTLQTFRGQHGPEYLVVRNFYQGMVNAQTDLPALRQFIADWQQVAGERSITQGPRWNEIVQSYRAARAAVDGQIARWEADARQRLVRLGDDLAAAVRAAGVPEAKVDEEAAALAPTFDGVRGRLGDGGRDFAEARGLLAELTQAEMTLRGRIQSLRARYRVETAPQAVHLSWQEVVGRVAIASPGELDQVVGRIKDRVLAELERNQTVIVE